MTGKPKRDKAAAMDFDAMLSSLRGLRLEGARNALLDIEQELRAMWRQERGMMYEIEKTRARDPYGASGRGARASGIKSALSAISWRIDALSFALDYVPGRERKVETMGDILAQPSVAVLSVDQRGDET